MKILQAHLNQFIKSPKNVLDLTNTYITEVDSFKNVIDTNNLVVGLVKEVKKHENADTLSVTKVDLGEKVEQIVCGAPNVKEGQYVIVAKEGAVLPGDFVIKPTKLRGVESNGMICSLEELGFDKELVPSEYQDGIFYFNEAKEIGSNALKHLMLDGYIMELDLTPNRNDLLSHYGFARDLSAVLKSNIHLPKFKINEIDEKNPLTVKIESKNTNSYYARYFKDVKVEESPLWLKAFLTNLDVKPVNNIVDITNYILFTYGIPMHAFDADKFGSTNIVVKDNNKKQTVKTLDDSNIEITKDEILITNGKDIMALGGIMGLDNSKITNDTKNVILEVASFSKEQTRVSSKKLNLKSDSSLRFERGIDEAIMMQALNHATYLFENLGQAKTLKGISSDEVKTFDNPFIKVELAKVRKLIDNNISDLEIIDNLKRLNYEIINDSKTEIIVKAPSYRQDILIFADVLEEVVRIYGMDQVKNQSMLSTTSKGLTKKQKLTRQLRMYLSSRGFNEVVTYSLLKNEDVDKYNQIGEKITLLKPMSQDRTTLRQSLLNGLVNTKKYNNARHIDDIHIFEIGNIYAKGIEQKALSALITSNPDQNDWKKTNNKIDFYYLSGILRNVFEIISVDYNLKASNYSYLHPYQQADIIVNEKIVGVIGKLNPKDIKNDTFVFEIILDLIDKEKELTYLPISKYPSVERDIALILEDDILMDNIIKVIKQTGKEQLVNLTLFDIYKGENIAEGYKSVALKLEFNDRFKTLESKDVDKLVNRIIKRLEYEYKAEIR